VRELNVSVTTHGRVLVEDPDWPALSAGSGVEGPGPLRLLVGFHGYAQNADEMLDMMRSIPEGSSWTRVSVQALHRFYRRRSDVTVASWMTRQDRDLLIADNVAYVDSALAALAGDRRIERLAYCGFSQGVAMAFRAAILGATRADIVLALGGDVPPELLADRAAAYPRVLLARGTRDEFYTTEKLHADEAALSSRGARVETLTFDGGHEWHADFAIRAGVVLS
jgi:predicted esterase